MEPPAAVIATVEPAFKLKYVPVFVVIETAPVELFSDSGEPANPVIVARLTDVVIVSTVDADTVVDE